MPESSFPRFPSSPARPSLKRSALLLGLAAMLAVTSACATRAQQASKANKAVKTSTRPDAAGQAASEDALDVVTYGARTDVMALADSIAERRQLDAAWVRDKLAQSRFQPAVARYIMPPPAGTAKNWAAYRSRFVEPKRIRAGVAFWQGQRRWLEQAEQIFGVPPEIVVGIIGVETIYGQQMGNFRVIDALATLSFDFPQGRSDRSSFFRDELEQLFVLSRSEGIDPLELRGSYAGAMGMPQFMPSSWNKYAVDFDGDGRVNLNDSPADVIGSVAHYLAEFGWQRGRPTHFEVAAPVAVRRPRRPARAGHPSQLHRGRVCRAQRGALARRRCLRRQAGAG